MVGWLDSGKHAVRVGDWRGCLLLEMRSGMCVPAFCTRVLLL